MAEEKLVWTIRHDIQQSEHMENYIHIYAPKKVDHGRGNYLVGGTTNGRKGVRVCVWGGGGGEPWARTRWWPQGGHDETKTPSDGRREVWSHIAAKMVITSGGVDHDIQDGSVAAGKEREANIVGKVGLTTMWLATGSDPDTRTQGLTRGLYVAPQIQPKF
jgi:hypothetical protein